MEFSLNGVTIREPKNRINVQGNIFFRGTLRPDYSLLLLW